jgi:hypothetical protein
MSLGVALFALFFISALFSEAAQFWIAVVVIGGLALAVLAGN